MAGGGRGGNIWRTAALVILCGLVYYFSYAGGRDAARGDYEAMREESGREMEALRREISRLGRALAECGREKAAVPPKEAVPRLENAAPPAQMERVSLRSGQSKIIFGGRLVLTLLEVAGTENRVLIQLNFLKEERLLSESLAAGGSLKFSLDKRDWALVAGSISMSSAVFNLVEMKNNDD